MQSEVAMSKRERREEQRKQFERRRRRAAKLLERGVTPAEVARRVGVSRTSVHRWGKRLEQDGERALKRAARLGRPRGLDNAQRARLAVALKQGALAQGYATELWTLARVGQLIEKLFSRRYSHSQVWRILCDMGFSCQRPTGRAIERDESAIRQWKRKRWPALKKTPRARGAPSSSSTSRA
jgi:transposase